MSWNVKVSRPIWPKSSPKPVFSIGYIAGSSACIMSFSRWQKLMAPRTANAAWGGTMG